IGMAVLGAVAGSGVGAAAGNRNGSSAFASFSQPSSPLESWSTPLNFTNDNQAFDIPWIGAAPNGAVTIGWERRDDTSTYVEQTSNTSLNGAFRAAQQLDAGGVSDTDRNIRVAADSLGRRWVAWWKYSGSNTCDAYYRVD